MAKRARVEHRDLNMAEEDVAIYRRKAGFGPLTVIVSSGKAYTITHEHPGPLPKEALEILQNAGLLDTVEPVG